MDKRVRRTSLYDSAQYGIVLKPRSDRLNHTLVWFRTHDCSRQLRKQCHCRLSNYALSSSSRMHGDRNRRWHSAVIVWRAQCAHFCEQSWRVPAPCVCVIIVVRGVTELVSDVVSGAGRCPIIGPLPRNVPPADNFASPARQPRGRGEFLPVNCQPGKIFLGGAIL